jgi:predicted Zn-dependent protease
VTSLAKTGLTILLVLVAAAGVALPRPARAEGSLAPSAQAAYDLGQSLISQRRYPEAIEKLKEVTVADPAFAPGWYGLALAARRSARCGEAISAYRRYATLRPAEAEPYFGLGLCLRDTGDRPGAVAALKKFLEIERRPGQEKWIDTAKSLLATLETVPANGSGAAAYADAQRLRDGGQIQPALAKFADAAALEPDLMASRAAWGELLVKIGRDADAVTVFRAALDRNPQYPLIWYELAFALRETGRLQEAVDAYRRYIPLRPQDPDPHYGLARALAKLGRGDEAVRSYETYVAMEHRPGEDRWVAAARGEIVALQQHRKGGNAPPSGATVPAAVNALPGAVTGADPAAPRPLTTTHDRAATAQPR